MKEELRKKQEGITLVALVVTIVVLLILAGITIMYTMGENSIFKKAQEAKDKTAEAIKNEQEYMNSIDNMLNEYVNGTGNGGTSGPEEIPIENIKSDWATIEKIAKEIAKDDRITSDSEEATVTVDGKKYTIKLGDLFEVEYNGEVKRVRVLGFKHDDLVDTSVYGGTHTKASISFEFYDCLGKYNMNGTNEETSTNANGWAATEMRTFLEGTEGRGKLNNNSYLKQVKKKYIKTYNDANSVTTSNDYLWLLSASEVLKDGYTSGAYGYAITKEGEQYLYYRNNATEEWNTASSNRIKYNNGSMYAWWLRSPGYSASAGFCGVSADGYGYGNPHSYSTYGVAPGFCI